MSKLFWIGLAVLVLGLASLVVPIPRSERDTVRAAGMSMGVETRDQETVSPLVSGIMIVGGVSMMIAGKNRP
jgi:hypothetical protein